MKKYLVVPTLLALGIVTLAEEKINSTKLGETVITAERYEETPVIETAKNITVIDSDEIEKRGYRNVEETLFNIPGISFSGENISMRGQVPSMGDKHLIVLVDGIPQNGMENRTVDFDFIPVESIEKIEVVPAGGAIMYGGSATSGVINIVTKDMKDRKYWGGIGVLFGSFNEKKYNINYGMNITPKLSIDTKYINLNKDGYRDYEKKRNEHGEINLSYKLEDGKLGFKYIRNEKKSNDSGYLTKEQYEEDRKQNDPAYKEKEKHDIQDKYVLEFSKRLSENLSNSTVVEYRDRDYTYSQPGGKSYSSYKSRIKNTDSLYLNTQFKYVYGNNSSLILGGDYSLADVEEDKYKAKNYVYKDAHNEIDYDAVGGYILNKYVYNKFNFTQGIRVERVSFDEDTIEYKDNGSLNSKIKNKESKNNTDYELAMNYMVSEVTSTYLSYNRVYRAPTITEYGSWRKIEGKIEPRESQKVDTIELGVKSLIENVYLSGALFYIRGDNEIMYDAYRDKTTNDDQGSFYNLDGKTERKGIELTSEQYFDKLTLRENLTYMDNKIVNGPYSGKEIPGVSNLIIGLGVTYGFSSKLSLNLESNYHGKAYMINDYYNREDKVDSYIVTNLSFKFDVGNGLLFKAGVDNLFNEIYCDYIAYGGVKSGKTKINYSPSPERTYYVSAEYRF